MTRDHVLASLKEYAKTLTAGDELWGFIFGHANATGRGLSIATKEGRLYGKDLAAALDAIACKQVIFCLNRQSAPLMPLLAKRTDRFVVTATSRTGHLNPPLFTKYLLNTWQKDPGQPLQKVLRQAGLLTREYYTKNGLAVAENSQAFDGSETRAYPYEGWDASLFTKLNLTDGLAAVLARKPLSRSRP